MLGGSPPPLLCFANALLQLSGGPPLSPEVSVVPTQPAWPYGLHYAARTYGGLTQPMEDASTGLLYHHLQSLLDLLASTMVSSSVDSEENGSGWAGADFFGLDDPGALR
jgi:hypothetical protein